MYSVTLFVTFLAVFKPVSSTPGYVYHYQAAGQADDCIDLPEKKADSPYECTTPASDEFVVKVCERL